MSKIAFKSWKKHLAIPQLMKTESIISTISKDIPFSYYMQQIVSKTQSIAAKVTAYRKTTYLEKIRTCKHTIFQATIQEIVMES